MAKMPGAQWRPLAAGHQGTMPKHNLVIVHTMVGSLLGTDRMFHEDGWVGTESHFGVGGKWGSDKGKAVDGVIYQWGDTAYRADANLDANPEAISIETADNAPGLARDIEDWTPRQIDAIVRIIVWACRTHNIPAVLVPDSKPGRRGIGYHRQGVEHSLGVGRVPGFLVVGGNRWSTKKGKECPGTRRIAQLKTVIMPRVQEALRPPKPPVKPPVVTPTKPVEAPVASDSLTLTTQYQADCMNLNDPKKPWKIGSVLTRERLAAWGGPAEERMAFWLRALMEGAETDRVQMQRIEDALAELNAKLFPPAPTEPEPGARTV